MSQREQDVKCDFVDKDEQVKGQLSMDAVTNIGANYQTIQEISYNQRMGDTKHEVVNRLTSEFSFKMFSEHFCALWNGRGISF